MENENIIENEENVEKPKKAGKGRIITSIVLLVLCAILVVGTVACSFIKKDFNPGVNDPDYIIIQTNNSSSSVNGTSYFKNSTNESNKAVYDEIMSLYKESFKTSFYTALFQGKAGAGVTEQDDYKSFSSISKPYIEFRYNTTQTLYVNGKPYSVYAEDRQAEGGQSAIVSNSDYISIIVEVVDSSSLTQMNIYFRYRDTGTNNYSYIYLSTYAKQSALYDYIANMK